MRHERCLSLEEQGIDFDNSDSAILVTPLKERTLLETLVTLKKVDEDLMPKAVQVAAVIQEHRTRAEGKPDGKSAQTSSSGLYDDKNRFNRGLLANGKSQPSSFLVRVGCEF